MLPVIKDERDDDAIRQDFSGENSEFDFDFVDDLISSLLENAPTVATESSDPTPSVSFVQDVSPTMVAPTMAPTSPTTGTAPVAPTVSFVTSMRYDSLYDCSGKPLPPMVGLCFNLDTASYFQPWLASFWNIAKEDVQKLGDKSGKRCWKCIIPKIDRVVTLRNYKEPNVKPEKRYWKVDFCGTIEEDKIASNPKATTLKPSDDSAEGPDANLTIGNTKRSKQQYPPTSIRECIVNLRLLIHAIESNHFLYVFQLTTSFSLSFRPAFTPYVSSDAESLRSEYIQDYSATINEFTNDQDSFAWSYRLALFDYQRLFVQLIKNSNIQKRLMKTSKDDLPNNYNLIAKYDVPLAEQVVRDLISARCEMEMADFKSIAIVVLKHYLEILVQKCTNDDAFDADQLKPYEITDSSRHFEPIYSATEPNELQLPTSVRECISNVQLLIATVESNHPLEAFQLTASMVKSFRPAFTPYVGMDTDAPYSEYITYGSSDTINQYTRDENSFAWSYRLALYQYQRNFVGLIKNSAIQKGLIKTERKDMPYNFNPIYMYDDFYADVVRNILSNRSEKEMSDFKEIALANLNYHLIEGLVAK